MSNARIPKHESFEKVAYLRNRGISANEIAKRIGLSRSRVFQIIKAFNIPKCTVCPHCGLDMADAVVQASGVGGLSPQFVEGE